MVNFESEVECSNVYVKNSTLSSKDNIFSGAFAKKSFKKDDIIEEGIVRLLPDSFDGNESPFVFTWSDEIPNKKWALASGCATFYNTSIEDSNCKMIRDFDNNKFQIIALRDINKDEELFHTYKSLQWRECFQEIRDILN